MHILWFVRNRPESALLMTAAGTVDVRGSVLADPEGYAQLRTAWLEQSAKKNASAAALANAGRFFLFPDKALAISFYAKAHKMEPDNPIWVAREGSAMAFAVVGITGLNQNGLPGPADTVQAASDESARIRHELENSDDAPLLTAAGAELLERGQTAQLFARQSGSDAWSLGEALFKRAQQLEPANRESHFGLARVYELRSSSVKSQSEKTGLKLARFEQLLKGTEGLPPDSPANVSKLLTFASASMDQGELDRAEAIGKNLLAEAPGSYQEADDTHYAHIVLGRVALRRGNIDSAKAHLLEAARTDGSPVLGSFGPTMTLAKELLEKGEKDVVLQYLELCRQFWTSQNGRIELWIAAIGKGEIPKFGSNLRY